MGPHLNPSKKRAALALYIDFLLCSALLAPAEWLLHRAGYGQLRWPQLLTVFLLLRFLFKGHFDVTPGTWSLGYSDRYICGYVHPKVAAAETWWTMLGGTALVLEGSKNLVRWTQGLPPPPFLGLHAPAPIALAAIATLGAFNLAAGIMILRANYQGAAIAAGVLAAELVGILMNRAAFREWAVHAVTARRLIQQQTVRPGEAEFMQSVATEYLPIALALGIVFTAAIGKRLWSLRTA